MTLAMDADAYVVRNNSSDEIYRLGQEGSVTLTGKGDWNGTLTIQGNPAQIILDDAGAATGEVAWKYWIHNNDGRLYFLTNSGVGDGWDTKRPLTIWGNNVGIAGSTSPQIALAIGDNDTGFQWGGDGILQLFANNYETMQIEPHPTLANKGKISVYGGVETPYNAASMATDKSISVGGGLLIMQPSGGGGGKIQFANLGSNATNWVMDVGGTGNLFRILNAGGIGLTIDPTTGDIMSVNSKFYGSGSGLTNLQFTQVTGTFPVSVVVPYAYHSTSAAAANDAEKLDFNYDQTSFAKTCAGHGTDCNIARTEGDSTSEWWSGAVDNGKAMCPKYYYICGIGEGQDADGDQAAYEIYCCELKN